MRFRATSRAPQDNNRRVLAAASIVGHSQSERENGHLLTMERQAKLADPAH